MMILFLINFFLKFYISCLKIIFNRLNSFKEKVKKGLNREEGL